MKRGKETEWARSWRTVRKGRGTGRRGSTSEEMRRAYLSCFRSKTPAAHTRPSLSRVAPPRGMLSTPPPAARDVSGATVSVNSRRASSSECIPHPSVEVQWQNMNRVMSMRGGHSSGVDSSQAHPPRPTLTHGAGGQAAMSLLHLKSRGKAVREKGKVVFSRSMRLKRREEKLLGREKRRAASGDVDIDNGLH